MKKLLAGIVILMMGAYGAALAQQVAPLVPGEGEEPAGHAPAQAVPAIPPTQPMMPAPPPPGALSDHMPPPPPFPPRSITVTGEGQGEFAADQAVYSLRLTSIDKDVSAAKQANDALVARVMTLLQQSDVPKEKIVTSETMLWPNVKKDSAVILSKVSVSSMPEVADGVVVVRSLRVTMDAKDMPEKVLSSIIGAGIDQTGTIEYQMANPESEESVLRFKALEDAHFKAEALAKAVNGKLGTILTINDTMDKPEHRQMAVMPLPGLVDMHETVTVTYALE